MATNLIKPQGVPKAFTPQAGGANPRMAPLIGIVKDNIDPIRTGRIWVYLSEFGGTDPNNSKSWTPVRFMSPFYGLTKSTAASGPEEFGDAIKNPVSYGMWNSPPDIGTQVICIFIKGDPNYGYYIGCIPEPEALHMVPAIGSTDNVTLNSGEAESYGGATRLPVTNINPSNPKSNSSGFLDMTKPVHSYVAGILFQQGLIRDPIRGVIGTSAQRESPSRVGWGISTPGRPLYTGGFTDETILTAAADSPDTDLNVVSRRAGHSFVMDDGDIQGRDQLIRLRTSLGHQILMSDDGQCLFIMHSSGQSWIELGKEGTIDMYASNSVNIRTQGDLNLHADNNININAMKALNISADTIKMTSEKETSQKVGTDFSFSSTGKYTVKVGSGMSMSASGEASYLSATTTYINGKDKVNLNSGFAGLVPQDVKPIPLVAHTDTLFDDTKGFAAAPGKLMSIVSRAPAHSPWASAGQGVDIKVSYNANDALASNPSTATTDANEAAGPI